MLKKGSRLFIPDVDMISPLDVPGFASYTTVRWHICNDVTVVRRLTQDDEEGPRTGLKSEGQQRILTFM